MITEDDFTKEINIFYAISQKLNDQWQLHQPDKSSYPQTPWLSKRVITKLQIEQTSQKFSPEVIPADICEIITPLSKYITGDYHIIYSHIYKVPMLFFNLSFSNGAKLKLDEVWELTHDTIGDTDKWSFLTEDEHPILSLPYFCLHPCNTGRFMECLLDKTAGSYLLMWISVVTPIIKLDIPLIEYYKYYQLS
ncbi:Ubiquitin-like-conjugating enzyme ATG10 [Oopsacas minuta]|uniref:Ubiquitin-like-conjugating enzyme ATG10 n=1 Tax=Oopsacas minuta TaxID=111878 RepID=A0AAV7K2N7_9METZ|nr:Ubiquitin-like-conjugating enzyme ATG10 [Oopsacas minuta]